MSQISQFHASWNFRTPVTFDIFSAAGRDRTGTIKDTIMHKISIALALLALVAASPLLAACQAAAGAGQDLSNGGKALTHSAEKNAPPGDR
jgi:predicted small secreted protein